MHIHLEPTHKHLTTIQFLVASPAFCRYSIYFLHCAPPIPTTIISTNTNTTKNKTLVAPPLVKPTIRNLVHRPQNTPSAFPPDNADASTPHSFFDGYDKTIHRTIDPTRARAISSEQQKNPAHSHGILILHTETSSMVPPNVVGYCVLHPLG